MKKKLTETKLRSALRLGCHLIGQVMCFGAVILTCSSAPAQNLFVSAPELDSSGFAVGGKIFEITPEGTQSVFASGLNYAGGLAFDSAGNLFVIEFSNGSDVPVTASILKFTPDGLRSSVASGLVNPFALAFDSAGNLFVTDGGNGSGGHIYEFAPTGVRSTFADLDAPAGLAFDGAGNLFVGAGGDGFSKTAEIYKFTPDGVRTTLASGLYSPNALAFDSTGNLFVADHGGAPVYDWPPVVDAAIYRFTPSGLRSTVASQNGQVPVFPNGLAIDSADNLFVTDGSYEILKFTRSGQRSVFASGFLGGSLAFQPTSTSVSGLLNISTRLQVGTSDNVLIGGFILQGTESKRVLIRAVGPSLEAAGVSGALANPTLELHDSTGALIGQNNDWRTTQIGGVITDDQFLEIQATGPPISDAESAIIATLDPGAYTAIVAGADSTTGIGLAEVYDLEPAPAAAKLANISTRGFVQTDDNVMIGGFIVGNQTSQVLVLGRGPSLAAAGISNALADPMLELHDGNGALLASNDNWRDTQEAEISATLIAPSDEAESAILQTLAPGAYTAIVRGVNNTTGAALVEVYGLD